MTQAEIQAIQILGDMVKEIARTNAESHQSISELIRDVEKRLCAKIEERDEAMRAIVEHCKARKIEVDAVLAKRRVEFDAEVAAAKLEAVREAKAPGVVAQASTLVGRRLFRAITVLAAVVGLLATLLVILERFGVV